MTGPDQIVAVADAARRQRGFAASLSSAFAAVGLGLVLRTHRELVAEVSIEQVTGQRPVVDPDRPLLWLCPGDGGAPDTPDGRFLASERLAAARSIAMLTRSPVLNRPSAVSLCGTFPAGPALGVRRARHHDAVAVRAERFTGTWQPGCDADAGLLEVHDYATSRSSYGLAEGSAGPFRCRAGVGSAILAKVRVIGDRTITTTDVPPAILAASRRLASWYQLDLAALWWLIGRDDGTRTLARIECWAWDAGFGGDVSQAAEAMADWMCGQLGRRTRISR